MLRIVEAGPGHAVMEMGIDYSRADVPERAYYADYCDVQKARVGYSLLFGKLIPGTSKLRTKVEVSFPEDMFRRQLWGTSRDFHETVRTAAEKTKLPPVENVEDTDKVQTFRSNNVFMGMWDGESLADFYYISPRDIHFLRIKKKAEVSLEPVVRIVMATALLYEFLEKCRPYAEGSPSEVEILKEGVL